MDQTPVSLLAQNQALQARVAALEATLHQLIDAMPNFVSLVDSDLRYQVVNRSYEEWFSRPREEIEGKTVAEVQGADNFAQIQPAIDRALRGEEVHYEVRMTDGQQRHSKVFDTRYLPHRHPDGTIVGFFVLAFEVTALRQTMHDLLLTRFAMDQAAEAMFTVGPDGRVLAVNRTACERLEYSAEELLGMYLWDFAPDCPAASWPQVWEGLRQHRRFRAETTHRTRRGQALAVEVSAAFVEFDGQQYACSFVRDISERQQSEERLRRSERLAAVGTLAAGIAHEINNPLGIILLLAEDMLRTGHTSEDVREELNEIIFHVRRCASIVSSVQQFARRLPLDKELLGVDGILRRAAELTRDRTQQAGIAVHVYPSPGLPQILGNVTALEQVVINLVHNAVRASTTGQTVKLACGSDEATVWLAVSDSGQGMSEEDRRRAFDPFFSTFRGSGGTGLGLSIAHGIVTDHGGTIEIDSAPGRGTVVTVRLPVPAA